MYERRTLREKLPKGYSATKNPQSWIETLPSNILACARTLSTLSAWGRIAEVCLAESLRHEEPALVIANDSETLLAGITISRLHNIPLVYDAHEFKAHEVPFYTSEERSFWLAVEGSLARHADVALTVSEPLAREMTRQLGRPFLCVPNCEPMAAPRMDAQAVVPHRGPTRVVFQGGFASDRGLDRLIRAFKNVHPDEIRLDIRGPDNVERRRLLSLAQDIGCLGRTVFFLPAVGEDSLITSMYGYEIGVIPYEPVTLNNRYCCPNKLSQYMRAGLALLVNDLPYVRSIVERFDCGDSYSSDSASIIDAIQRMRSDPNRLIRQRLNALRATNEFAFETMSHDAFVTIRSLLDRSRATSKGWAP